MATKLNATETRLRKVTGNTMSVSFRLMEVGGNMHPIESVLVYSFAFWFYGLSDTGDWGCGLVRLATTNAIIQVALFSVVVQIPCYVTGRMSNVDLAWPTGLVLLALQALYHGATTLEKKNEEDDGVVGYEIFLHRTFLMGIALLLHGGRMAIGAFVLYFPFDWSNGDLSRYQYAKTRWSRVTGAEHLWWLKQQHDTIMQAYANSVYLAVPILLVASNPNPCPLHLVEIVGFGCWFSSWILESVVDVQKVIFVRRAIKNGDVKTAVLGYPPYDGRAYWIWTKCRHPNYFFEWICWNSYIIMSIPSAFDLLATDASHRVKKLAIFVLIFHIPRITYDCLLYWTGSEPAESRSVKRRPSYKQYQETTNIFFPFPVPFVNHHRTPGWPILNHGEKTK
mmetsp:Transcript_18912/g.52819  ORF Transcript_18912/g.52819 Transcript_18912/m.52819 type:complete len:394 (+) Transcript_18912:236-1417(+)